MARNGSPPPRFSTDEGRTYFLAELPVHPDMRGVTLPGITDQVTDKSPTKSVGCSLSSRDGPLRAADITQGLGMTHRPTLRDNYLRPGLAAGLVEMTIPDKPNSGLQKYRLTPASHATLADKRRPEK